MTVRPLLAAGLAIALGACETEPSPPPLPGIYPHKIQASAFFDFDSAALTEQGLKNLAPVATAALHGRAGPVRVVGHTDRSGAQAYNMDLSRRRAEAVRDGLIRLGVPADRIQLKWRGENQPLITTEDGVREPVNRYASAEIDND